MLIHLIEIFVFSFLIMLSCILFLNPLKVNKKANLWFSFTLLLWATYWLDEILILIKVAPFSDLITLIISFIQFFTPALLYLSILFFTNPNHKFKTKDVTIFILPFIYFGLLILNRFLHYNLQNLLLFLVLTYTIIYTLKSYLKLRSHQRKIKLFSSNTNDTDLKWLENIILIIVLIVIVISAFNLIYIGLPLNLHLNIVMLITILFIAYNALKQKEIFPVNEKHRNEVIAIKESEKIVTKRKILSDEELVKLKSKLNLLMKEEHLYLNHDINLASLSEKMKITPHQLSYIINNGFNQNFFQFINTYRVDKAKELLSNKDSNKLSILGIAYESGFNSKTAFNTTFKKFTNQTPSEYKKHSSSL